MISEASKEPDPIVEEVIPESTLEPTHNLAPQIQYNLSMEDPIECGENAYGKVFLENNDFANTAVQVEFI